MKKHHENCFVIGLLALAIINAPAQDWRGRNSKNPRAITNGWVNTITHVHSFVVYSRGEDKARSSS